MFNPTPISSPSMQLEIRDILLTLIANKSRIYSMKAVPGVSDSAIISLFANGFYPSWIQFFDLTRLGFDEENQELKDLIKRANAEIDGIQSRACTMKDVKDMIKTCDEYLPHVKVSSIIKINDTSR